MNDSTISAVVPTYNEAGTILDHLRYHTTHFEFDSLVVVDGGSSDGTFERVKKANLPVRLLQITPGNRARQLAEGVRSSDTDYLLFLHADSFLPESFSIDQIVGCDSRWGWFDSTLDEPGILFDTIGTLISLRSAFFSSPTGDQAIWVRRDLLEAVDGIPDQPLMEDVELSNRLRQVEPGHSFDKAVETSARRWKQNGAVRTVLTMWGLKVGYYLGVSPETLAEYYYGRSETTAD